VYSYNGAGANINYLTTSPLEGNRSTLSAEPADQPLSVEDYVTTVYHLLGIDASKSLMSPGDRPQPIVLNGSVAQGLLA
jgi:hypothetical protein